MRLLYLVHDLSDSAVWRRVAMLERAGATVSVAGFDRGKGTPGGPAIRLGLTRDGKMRQRVMAVARAMTALGPALRHQTAPDAIIARNLEMLALARRARMLWRGPRPRLVYEVLDIHRMMLGEGRRARTLRRVERWLAQPVDLVLTSSPAFVRHYFDRYRPCAAPVRVVENKSFGADLPRAQLKEASTPPPLVIGWFGILRCAVSLDVLDRLTRHMPGRLRVDLRGRPAYDAIPDFDGRVAANPDLVFHGPFRNPEDLGAIYGAVHLAWAVDRFDAGENSDWLLPNRLYEGCLHGAVPIALAGTELARLLAAEGIGIVLPDLAPETVAASLALDDPDRLARLRGAVANSPAERWAITRQDCDDLLCAIVQRPPARPRQMADTQEVLS
ncbi:MAG: glycosyltransferase family 4 protein [Rhodobacterales bacterium]|nr:glycosyltransferase family 4 protein [Rhodobacterales bacterium]